MIKDITGEVTFEVISSRSVDDRMKELAAAYKKAYVRYKIARRQGAEADKPTKPALKVIQKVRGKDKAEALAARCRKLYEEKKAREAQRQSQEKSPPA